ncbi:MAG: primosomal protein N' [Acidobacteria bacterium]|nr:MAG: primosomal protein N' [Acidobacteriota bacterium]
MTSATQISNEAVPQYAQVAVPVHLIKTFTYRLPSAMQRAARVGSRVMIQLGAKPATGYIVALSARLREGTSLVESEIKDVQELLDVEPPLTPEVLKITRWVADYYATPWGEVMRAALPAGINATVEQTVSITPAGREQLKSAQPAGKSIPPALAGGSAKLQALRLLADEGEFELSAFRLRMGTLQTPKWLRDLEHEGLIERSYRTRSLPTRAKRRRAVRLVKSQSGYADVPPASLPQTEKQAGRPRTQTEAQQRAIETLRANQNAMAIADLINAANISESVVRTLLKKGLVEEFEEEMRRDPLARAELPVTEDFKLSSAQLAALTAIEVPLNQRGFAPILLHGITGSGKTEVYIRAMRAALDLDRGAMMLVPEIALTPILSRRLRAHFGDQIAIFHSSLSKGERFDEWSRLRRGEARVVLGTRSAVFAPVKDLGVIIIDEEQDASYRQEESPFYHARDTAIVRAQRERAAVVLGSATPSLESFHNSQTGKYGYLHLPERVANRPLAQAEIIDMRQVFARRKKPAVFSDELLRAIEETHLRREQTIILLNRRGYSSFILCRSCGESIECPNCDVALTYHRGDQTLVCHYCNHHQRAPSQCPVCGSKYIYYIGEGTEQIEELLRRRFPNLRLGRIDRDTKSRRHEFEKTLLDFGKGEIDLLVGTQMLAKGHDFPNVTLVGVVSVDAGLALPDFRAAERTFQLITQVAGRAGRGNLPGRVLIQTYHPHHYALRHACAQDYRGFYDEEIRHRRNHGYPPFVALALLLVHHKDPARARTTAQELRSALVEANQDHACRILGPAPAPLARLRGDYRIQLLVKSRSRKQMRGVIDAAMKSMEESGNDLRSVTLEIDPVSMM